MQGDIVTVNKILKNCRGTRQTGGVEFLGPVTRKTLNTSELKKYSKELECLFDDIPERFTLGEVCTQMGMFNPTLWEDIVLLGIASGFLTDDRTPLKTGGEPIYFKR